MTEEMNAEDKEEAAKLTTFEDVLEAVGSRGCWNVLLFVLCSYCSLCSAFITMSYQFLGVTPDHWCHVEPLREANWTDQQILDVAIPFNNKTGQHALCHMYVHNYTRAVQLGYGVAASQPDQLTDGDTPQVVSCSVRDFALTEHVSSVVTEWDLVCERRVLYSTTQAINQFGFLIGAIVTPIFTDKFGRRPVALCATALAILLGMASCFSPSAEVFIALRWGLSATSIILYLSVFLIVMELCTPATRTSFVSLFLLPWGMGCMILPGVAYLVRPWRYLQATITLPFVVFIIMYRILPESPRWLLLKGRYQDAQDILVRIATNNGRRVPETVLRVTLTRIGSQIREEQKRHGQDEPDGKIGRNVGRILVEAVRKVLLPYSTVQLVRRTCLLLVLWFSVSSAYYGISLNATNISADLYLYIFLGGVCEVFAYLLLRLLMAYAGRRPSLSGLCLICAVSIAVNFVLMLAFPAVPVAAKMCLSLLGRMAIAAAFHLAYIFTAELFTTKQRSLAIGHCSFFGRIGSMASPYINDILGDTSAWAPSAVFATMAILSSLIPLFLPETWHQNLPEEDLQQDHADHAEEKGDGKKPVEGSLSH